MPPTTQPLTSLSWYSYELRKRRTGLRLSQAYIAKRAGTSQATVALIESGRGNPTIHLLERLAAALPNATLDVRISTKPQA
jgi:transcriptional regulator with XRE-family HTH domain